MMRYRNFNTVDNIRIRMNMHSCLRIDVKISSYMPVRCCDKGSLAIRVDQTSFKYIKKTMQQVYREKSAFLVSIIAIYFLISKERAIKMHLARHRNTCWLATPDFFQLQFHGQH